MRRRLDALKVFCMCAGAYALADVAKKIVSEPRPPAALQAVAADSGASFPSGHASVGVTLCIALVVIAVTYAGCATALVLGGLYAVAVACSRFYLGDHYPLDVAGSLLCAVAAAFAVTGLAALPAVQPCLRRLDRAPSGGCTQGTGPDQVLPDRSGSPLTWPDMRFRPRPHLRAAAGCVEVLLPLAVLASLDYVTPATFSGVTHKSYRALASLCGAGRERVRPGRPRDVRL